MPYAAGCQQHFLGFSAILKRARPGTGHSAIRALISYHEDPLARPREAQLLAGESLDRSRVLLEILDLLRQAPVLLSQLIDLASHLLGALALADELEDPAVSEEGSHHKGDQEDDREEGQRLLAKARLVAAPFLPMGQVLILYFRE